MGATQSIAELSEEAHRANDAGLYVEARHRFLEIVKLEPRRNAARVSAANMAMKAGNAEVALEELNALLARKDLSQACLIVAKRNQAAAAKAVAMARAERLENFSPASPKRLEREASQLSERSPQAWNGLESIDRRLARLARQQKDAEARPRRWFFLSAVVVIVACLAYAYQTEVLTLPTFTRGLVGDTPSTTSGSESKTRGGRGWRRRGRGAAAGPQGKRNVAKPTVTAVHEVNLRSHLLGLSEHFANASSSAIAHLPSEFTELSSPGQFGLIVALALSSILMLGYCVLRFATRATRGRDVSEDGGTDYANTLAKVVADLSYDSPTPEHLWYHPVRLAPHLHLPARVPAQCRRALLALAMCCPPAREHAHTHAPLCLSQTNGWPTAGWAPPRNLMDFTSVRLSRHPPPELTPTAAEAPCLHPAGGNADAGRPSQIGELKLELISADRIMKTDLITGTDAYAIVVCEGTVARSATVFDTESPRWPATSARAFRIPVYHPSSLIQLGLFDSDETLGMRSIDLDDTLGRVTIPLSGLRSNTVYDCWHPLQVESFRHHAKKYGSIRLRYSVSWKSEAARVKAVLSPPPSHQIVIKKLPTVELVDFTQNGDKPESEFSLDCLTAQSNELYYLTFLPYDAIDALYNIALWTRPARSLTICVGWQLVCIWPHLIPSAVLLFLASLIADQYSHRHRHHHPALRKPSIAYMVRALVGLSTIGDDMPSGPPVLARRRSDFLDGSILRASTSGSLDEADASDDDLPSPTALEVWDAELSRLEARLREEAQGSNHRKTSYEKKEPRRLGRLFNVSERVDKAAAGVRDLFDRMGDKADEMNPVAKYGAQAQFYFGWILEYVRTTRSLWTWGEPAVTFWFFLSLIGAALVLAVAPWAMILRYTMHATGAAFLGPHMIFYRNHNMAKEAGHLRRAEKYQTAKPQEKKYFIAEEMLRIKALIAAEDAAETKRIEGEMRKLPKAARLREIEHKRLIKNAEFVVQVDGRRLYGGAQPFPRADPLRSRAYPVRC